MTIHPRIAAANRCADLIASGVPDAEARRMTGFAPSSAPHVVDVGMSDFELATRRLSREFPETPRETIMLRLGTDGLDIWRNRIEEERQLVLTDKRQAADLAHAHSPEGRKAAAQAADDAQLKKASDARLARLLLIEEGKLSEGDTLSDDEALAYAGFVQTADPFLDGASDYAANLRAAGEAS